MLLLPCTGRALAKLPPPLAASACADAEPEAEPEKDIPPPLLLCAKAAVEPNAVVKAKIPAITKGFFIVASGVLRMTRIAAKKRHQQQFGPSPQIKKGIRG